MEARRPWPVTVVVAIFHKASLSVVDKGQLMQAQSNMDNL
jgi:hypothetical protein